MSDRLLALRVFARVARTGSFSSASRELGLSQPSASRVFAALEEEVGARLITRTTRSLALTEAGASYLNRIEPILVALDEADQSLRCGDDLRGSLRVALSSSFAMREVIPRLPSFMERHPALRVELLVSDQRQHLVNEGIDVALRLGTLSDTSAVARRLGQCPRLLAAAPSYLLRAGAPSSPQELAQHSIIVGPTGLPAQGFTFQRGDRKEQVRVDGKLVVSTTDGAVAAASAGLGILAIARWGCRVELERGTLVRVLGDWDLGSVAAHAVFPAGRSATTAARVFIDHLAGMLD